MFPNYTVRERVADGCIHVIGITASLVALTVLLVIGVQSQMTLWVVSLAIYGLALVAMFSCSAPYNLILHPPKLKPLKQWKCRVPPRRPPIGGTQQSAWQVQVSAGKQLKLRIGLEMN